jgi:hypothetical protein
MSYCPGYKGARDCASCAPLRKQMENILQLYSTYDKIYSSLKMFANSKNPCGRVYFIHIFSMYVYYEILTGLKGNKVTFFLV